MRYCLEFLKLRFLICLEIRISDLEFKLKKFGPLAHLVEHHPFKVGVPRSSRGRLIDKVSLQSVNGYR